MLLFVLATLASASSCTLSTRHEAAAAKTYDSICIAEPPLYATFVVVAVAREASQRTLARAELLHSNVGNLCANRPTNLFTGLASLSSYYAQFIALNASLRGAQ